MVWLVAPSLIAGHQGGVGSIRGRWQYQGTRYWSLRAGICSEFSDVFEKPGTPPERAIKNKIDLLPDSVPPAKRLYRISPNKLAEVRKQLDEYLSKS